MYIATMDSESKTWISLGGTTEEAKGAILDKWNYEQREMAARGYIEEATIFDDVGALEYEYEINIVKVQRGECVNW